MSKSHSPWILLLIHICVNLPCRLAALFPSLASRFLQAESSSGTDSVVMKEALWQWQWSHTSHVSDRFSSKEKWLLGYKIFVFLQTGVIHS